MIVERIPVEYLRKVGVVHVATHLPGQTLKKAAVSARLWGAALLGSFGPQDKIGQGVNVVQTVVFRGCGFILNKVNITTSSNNMALQIVSRKQRL